MSQPVRPSFLPNLRVASPCPADWNAMTVVDGDRVRACGQCNKNVYNLSNMTRAEAEALIVEKEGKLCARYFQRSDGTILLKDCLVRRKNRLVAAGAAALLAGGLATLLVHDRHPAVAASIAPEPGVEITAQSTSLTAHDDPPPPAPPEVIRDEPVRPEDFHEIKGDVGGPYEEIQGDISMDPIEAIDPPATK